MSIIVLNAADVRRLLPSATCIELMRTAFKLEASGGAIQPIRTGVRHPNGRGLMGMMPGYIAEPQWLGIKVVSVFPGNFGTQFGSHQGFVLLFESEHGAPAAILDGREITAIRTAAATAAATDALARRDVRTLGVLGYGEQADTHLEALTKVRDFERCLVWGRDPDKARAFAAQQSIKLDRHIEAASIEDAATADIVCTVTASDEPVFFSKWLRPGQHLNVVGSSIPTTSEIDIETVVKTRVFVDFAESARALAGDLRRALAAGAINEDHVVGSVGQVVLGQVEGRRGAEDITLFKSLGMIAEDLVACDFVLAEARRTGAGQFIEWDAGH